MKVIFRRRRSPTLVLAVWLLAAVGLTSSAEAAFPGLNGKIAFSRAVSFGGNPEVYVMAADGSGQGNLTNDPASDYGPAFSPDGGKIAFTRSFRIYVMNADGSGQRNLTDNQAMAIDGDPAFSPDGSKIAFTRNPSPFSPPDVYVMNADGSGQTNLTDNPASDYGPVFSPDGSKIAFTTARTVSFADTEVYVMNADGSGQRNVTNNPATDRAPAFSPDGSKITFERFGSGGNNEIYLMNADGSGQTNLTNNPASDQEPAFSPDGTKVAFTRRLSGANAEVYVMNGDGSAQTNRTNNPADDFAPDWQPLVSGPRPPLRPPPRPPADTTAPVISNHSMARRRFAVAGARTPRRRRATPRGSVLRFRLSEDAAVAFTIERALPGRRSTRRRGACLAPERRFRRRPRCTRYQREGAFVRRGKQGPNSATFSGRIGRRALKPGRYRVSLRATDAAGNRSRIRYLDFRVARY